MADWIISGDAPVTPKTEKRDEGWSISAGTPTPPEPLRHEGLVDEDGTPVPGGPLRGQQRILDNSADDSLVNKALKFAGTAVGKGLSHIPGQIGDLNDLGRFIVLGGESLVTGKKLADVYRESDERMKGKPKTWLMQAPSGKDIYDWSKIGEYEPDSQIGKWSMAGLEAGLGGMSPGGLGYRMVRGAVPAEVSLAKEALKSNAKQGLTYGTIGGAAADATTDVTGSPGLGAVAGLTVPMTAAAVGKPLANYTAPMFKGNERQLAREMTLKTTNDPETSLARLQGEHEIVPGTNPTTAAVTGDVGHARAQETAFRNTPEFRDRMIEQQGQQNQARLGILRPLASPDAEPKAVSQAFQDHLALIEKTHADEVARTGDAARAAGQGIPEAQTMETLGAGQRGAVAKHHGEVRELFKKLYSSIDPDGKLAIVADDIAGAVERLSKSAVDHPMKTQSALAKESLDKAATLPRVAKFQDILDLDQDITQQMRKAAKADDWHGHEQLVDLKRATKKAINEAVENQVKFEQAAMQRGEMPWEKTLAYNLQRSVDHWYGTKAGLDTQGQAAAAAGAGSRTVPVSAGGDGPGTVPPGIEGVPGSLEPNFTADSAQRLELANKGYGMWKDEKRPLDAAMKTQPIGSDYRMSDARIPAQAFGAGDTGYTSTSNWLRNANNSPEAVANMQAIATTRLREAMKGDEMLTPDKLAAWKQKYQHSLRAIDEVSPGFSQRFDDAATATAAYDQAVAAQKVALKEAQKSDYKRFIGASDADDVRALVGRDLEAPDSGRRVTDMVDKLKGNPEALEGYKTSVLDWILNKVSTAGRDADMDPLLSGAKLTAFVYQNPTAIKALFGDEGLDYMRRVSADMQRTQRLLTMQKSAVGSDTASYLIPFLQASQSAHGNMGMLPWLMAGWEAWKLGGTAAAASVMGVKGAKDFVGGLRNQGIRNATDLYLKGLEDPVDGRALLQEAMTNGQMNEQGLRRLTAALRRSLPAEETVEREYSEQREGRARGGAVVDHSAAAKFLSQLVGKARKQTTERTKPLLDAHDSVVAHALDLAGRSI